WTGRSDGAHFRLAVENSVERISVFTTRLDTLFGVTYLAVAPEHPAVSKIVTKKQRAPVEQFAQSLRSKSELERTSLMEKDGIFTGAYAINPLSHERVPVWVTNYVLAEYGTGAVMGVPGHDQRDFEFARKHGLPVAQVVAPPGSDLQAPFTQAYLEDGRLIAS